jgi:DNA-binding NarL/FixJ family response regulator
MRVLIADDHALFREGLSSLLCARGIEVVGEARTGREAVRMARALRPDVVLMDLAMPEMDGLAATRIVSAELPEVKVVVLTGSEDDASLIEAVKSGAQGYLLKNVESEHLFTLLTGVLNGEPAFTPGLARKVLAEFAHPAPSRERGSAALTEREHEVLNLLVRGVTSNRQLAERLTVSENTVKYHLRNILDKLHLENRAQVVAYALGHRLAYGSEPESPLLFG